MYNKEALIVLGYDNKVEISEFIGRYVNDVNDDFIINQEIYKPTYEDVAEYNNNTLGEFQLNMEYMEKDIYSYIKNDNLARIISKKLFQALRDINKPISIVKNQYIRTIVTIKAKFIPLIKENGKILYIGNPNSYERFFLTLLNGLDVDIVVLDIGGNTENYREIGEGFRIINGLIRERIEIKKDITPTIKDLNINLFKDCLNYLELLSVINEEISTRSRTHLELIGIPLDSDKYLEIVSGFLRKIKALSRKFALIENGIPNPTYEESTFKENIIKDEVVEKLKSIENNQNELSCKVINLIDNLVKERSFSTEAQSRNYKLVLLIWLKRYLNDLLSTNDSVLPIVIIWGGLSDREEDFITILSLLPLDIIHFSPSKNDSFKKALSSAYKVEYESSINVEAFPKENVLINVNTVAYEAEKELDTLLYGGNSGIYRPSQFNNVNSITLKTTYDEVFILWNQDSKFRPHFNTVGDLVEVGTIFTKIDGIPPEGKESYVSNIKQLLKTENTLYYDSLPFTNMIVNKDWSQFVRKCIFNNGVDFEKILNSSFYKYRLYSKATQDLIVDKIKELLKLDWLIDDIKNLTYEIIEVLFMLPDDIVKLIHNYDFTSNIPKLVIFGGKNEVCNLTDNIIIMFLKLIGFDIVVLAPTGYQILGDYIKPGLYNHITIGSYDYNISIENTSQETTKNGFLNFVLSRIIPS